MRRLFGSEINEEKGGTYREIVGIGRLICNVSVFFSGSLVLSGPTRAALNRHLSTVRAALSLYRLEIRSFSPR
jgi:hypothetical protein